MKDTFIIDNTLINATSLSLDVYQDFFISWSTGDQWLGVTLPINEYQSVTSSGLSTMSDTLPYLNINDLPLNIRLHLYLYGTGNELK